MKKFIVLILIAIVAAWILFRKACDVPEQIDDSYYHNIATNSIGSSSYTFPGTQITWVTNAISFTRAKLTVSYKYSEPGKNMRAEDVTVWSAIKPTVVEKDGGWQITFDHQDELTPTKVNTGYNQPLLHQFGIPSDEQIIGTSLDATVAGFPPRLVTTDKGVYEFDGKKYQPHQPKQNP